MLLKYSNILKNKKIILASRKTNFIYHFRIKWKKITITKFGNINSNLIIKNIDFEIFPS
jgi:hypothetical protein